MKYILALSVCIMIGSTALADDPFGGHGGGAWLCADGRRTTDYPCRPNEINGNWWAVCIPGRTDCAHSDTAVIGWDPERHVVRGPGYCYTLQPYTCSPDGKLP
jgi:hypothetical protein